MIGVLFCFSDFFKITDVFINLLSFFNNTFDEFLRLDISTIVEFQIILLNFVSKTFLFHFSCPVIDSVMWHLLQSIKHFNNSLHHSTISIYLSILCNFSHNLVLLKLHWNFIRMETFRTRHELKESYLSDYVKSTGFLPKRSRQCNVKNIIAVSISVLDSQ